MIIIPNQHIVLYFIQLILLFILSVQDCKHKKVSLHILLIFIIATLLLLDNQNFPLALLITGIILMVKISFILLLRKSIVGNGDIILIFPMLLCLKNIDIGQFLIVAGVFGIIFGIIWKKLKKQDSFPMVPSLSIAYSICIIGRL